MKNLKIISQKGGLLTFFGALTKVGLLLTKNVFTSLAKSVLIPLGLMTAASATDSAIQKKILGSYTTAIKFSNG